MPPVTHEAQRAELHKTIWRIASDLRGSVDGWDFKSYVLGMLFYRFISENLTAYLNELERKASNDFFDYANLSDKKAEFGRKDTVEEKGFYILPSQLFANVRSRAAADENLNETLDAVFKAIEGSAVGADSEDDIKGLFADLDVNSAKLGNTVAIRNKKLVKLLEAIGDLNLGDFTAHEIDAFGDAYEYLMQMYAADHQAQDYRSIYLDFYAEFRKNQDAGKERINEDIVFEIELIKQVEINVGYILMLVDRYRRERGDGDDKEIRAEITRAIDASPSLRNKKDLIESFVDRVTVSGKIDDEWSAYIAAARASELAKIIEEENLQPEETHAFVNRAFRDGGIQTTGTAITKVLPPASRFAGDGGHGEKKQRVLRKLGVFFERFFGLSADGNGR